MTTPIDHLLAIMDRLRDPVSGCPWDKEQTFASIAPHTIEEAYEVAEAIETDDRAALRDELGDLLFQVVFHSRLAKEQGNFDFYDVVEAICEKMLRRHPHVFGDAFVKDVAAQLRAWESIKATERKSKAGNRSPSVLDGVSTALPATSRAQKLQSRAAGVGFDWPSETEVLDKIEEEIAELRAEMRTRESEDGIADEMGDLLFACVNLARKLKVDPEAALRRCNRKFERRFHFIERELEARGRRPEDASLEEMEAFWIAAKRLE